MTTASTGWPPPTPGSVSGVDRPQLARHGWWRLRPAAAVVAAVGALITGLLTWAAFAANDRSSDSVLNLQARQTASTLSAALPGIRSQLADAVTVAIDTDNPATFKKFVTNNVVQSTLASVSLWQRQGTQAVLLTTVGSQPQLVADGEAPGFFSSLKPSTQLQVTQILRGSPPRLGYAEFPPGDSQYIVYAEGDLPANKHLTIPRSSPFSQLNFALYLGRATDNAHLIEASMPGLLKGRHATVNVPFGNSSLTLVASPRTALTPGQSQALPWIALIGGAVLSLASAMIVNYLSRRRRYSDELNTELTRLYSAQRSIAETLQHSLLPENLPTVEGMEIAARYRPGAKGVDVGGDWYDVIVLDPNRFVFIVGDVSGRGARAAAVMASVRFAARGFALEGHPPAAILGHLARTLDFGVEGHFATVLCGLVDVARHEVTLANAGHLPPVVRTNDTVSVLDAPPTAPIGVATAEPPVHPPIRLPEGSLLLAYTDGLIERRGEGLDEAINRLKASALQDSAGLDPLLSSIVTDLTMDAPDDDVALLALRWLT